MLNTIRNGLEIPLRRLLLVSVLLLVPVESLPAAEHTVQLEDGASVRLMFFQPKSLGSPPPLAIIIPGGANNEFMAKVHFWLGKEFVYRGWAIAVPIFPYGSDLSTTYSTVIPQIVDELYATHTLHESKPLLVGMSSGGSEALAIAALNPSVFRGVVAIPGRIKDDFTLDGLDGLPFYIRVGEKDDFRWNRLLEPMAERLRQAGAEVDSAIVDGARHVFQFDWQSLDAWLANLKIENRK